MTTARTADSLAAVVDRVREARDAGTSMRLVGRGRWLDAGRPTRAIERLELGELTGITEYEPGDLTLTARAGTTLAEIAETTGREGQWLTLDPFGAPDGTIGATIATGSYGPLASAFGTSRDHLLGCEVVTGAGNVVRAGGRVVKNVAGFDLARLMCGAWGTLGAITEVSVRLRARPEVDRSLAIAIAHDGSKADPAAASEAAWRWLRESPYTPLAAELCSASLAALLEIGREATLLLRLGGSSTLVTAAERALASLGEVRAVDGVVWQRLRAAEPSAAVVARVGALPARIGPLWRTASDVAERAGGYAHAMLERGIVRVVLPAPLREEENGRLRGIIGEIPASGSRIFERLPAALWGDVASPVADALSRGVRRAYDPDHLLNPGILGDHS